MPRITHDFAEIEPEFTRRVAAMVYCNAATVDAQQRPRSRVIHPVWQDGVGWFHTMPASAKTRQLAANPHVSLAYIAEPFTPVYAECRAVVQNDDASRERVWELCKQLPAPYGFDPALAWGAVDSPTYVLVRLDPWRIELYDLLNQAGRVEWHKRD